jgi:predicted RNase H-like nuclease (RuvC/YqgF family)
MTTNKDFLRATILEAQLKKLKEENERLKLENSTFRELNSIGDGKPAEVQMKHLTTRKRKDGKFKVRYGVVMDVVRRSNGLTARQLVNLTGFDRYAIYAAAKRLKKALPSPYQK